MKNRDPLHHLRTAEMHFHFLVTFSHLSLSDFHVFYMQQGLNFKASGGLTGRGGVFLGRGFPQGWAAPSPHQQLARIRLKQVSSCRNHLLTDDFRLGFYRVHMALQLRSWYLMISCWEQHQHLPSHFPGEDVTNVALWQLPQQCGHSSVTQQIPSLLMGMRGGVPMASSASSAKPISAFIYY